jgi:predicted ATPase/DNA-binding SARP family transcriptional activator
MRCLGVADVTIDDSPITLHSRRSFAILGFVAVTGGRHARSSLASTFWEDAPTDRARANLRSVISMLQSSLPGLLDVSRDAIALRADAGVDLDVARFLDAAAAADDTDRTIDDRIRCCQTALGLYRGELLEGFEHLGIRGLTAWLETERSSLRFRAVATASLLVDLFLDDARPTDAIDAAGRLIALDPYREASYVSSADALLAAGEPQRALEELARCRAVIVDDLGLPLGTETLQLEQRIRAGHPATGSARPVISRLSELPPLRPLFGRHDLVELILPAVRTATTGLVTLCGPAGVGKTALAVTVAHRWQDRGRDVLFVDATTAMEASQLVELLANELGASSASSGSRDLLSAVVKVLTDRTVTVVLDNIEQVHGADAVLSDLLDRCPNLLVRATSGRARRIAWETAWPVLPLEPPSEAALAGNGTTDAASSDALASLACVQLFQHQCRAIGAAPARSPDDLRAVGRICREVDGLPLAIELVASRRRLMGLADIDASLRRGLAAGDLSLTDGGVRTAPERHGGLEATLTSSLQLLPLDATEVFAELAVFEGPFTFEVIEALCLRDGLDTRTLMRCVESLVEVHLLLREERKGRVWFRMLNPVRALASSLLAESGQRERLLERRIAHDCDLVERSADDYFGPANTDWFWFFDDYLPSLRSTLDELHARQDSRELAVVTSLAPYWFDRGRVAEAHRRLSSANESVAPVAAWRAPLRRLWRAGMRAETLGYGTAAGTLDEIEVELAAVLGADPPPVVELQALRLALHVHVVDPAASLEVAAALAATGITLADGVGHPWFRADFLFISGVIQHLGGDDARAAVQFRTAIAEAEHHGNRRVSLYARMMLDIVGGTGQTGGTPENLSELLDLAIELGDRRQTSWLTMSIGTLAVLAGDLHTGASHFLDALTLARDADYFIGLGCCLMGGAAITVLRDELTDAVTFHASVEPDLEALGRSMPQSYLDVYRQITSSLPLLADDDPDLAVAWATGASGPRGFILSQLAAALVRVRDDTATATATAPPPIIPS